MTTITRFLFVCAVSAASAGCGLMTPRAAPRIEEAPPYLQTHHQTAAQPHSQLSEIHAYHDKESAQMSRDVLIVRNREMEQLERAGAEIEKDQHWQEDYKKTIEKRERWTNWFKKKDKPKELQNPSGSSLMSDKASDGSSNLR